MTTRKVIRGDSDSFTITFVAKTKGRSTTQPINICGWDIRFTVRSSIPSTTTSTDRNAVIFKQASIVDASKGIAYITITSEDTNIEPGEYYYDIQYSYTDSTTGERKVKSLPKGKYVILSDITRDQRGY